MVIGQDYPHDYVKYPFVNTDENVIKFPGDSTSFDGIYKKLENILFKGEGKLDILHIGGSHIQAGVFSGVMRKIKTEKTGCLLGDYSFLLSLRSRLNNSELIINREITWINNLN